MRKAMLWIKLFFYLIPMWMTALKCRREPFEVRFWTLKHWAEIVTKATGAKITATGLENVPKGTVYYVSNHEGSLDPFIFIDKVPYPATLISKVENLRIPIIGAWMKTIECITLDRSNVRSSLQMVKTAAAALEKGRSVIVYPEGTRSKGLSIGDFKAGALKPALMAKVPIVPVTVVNTYLIDVGGKANYHCRIAFGKPIAYEEFKDLGTVELAGKVLDVIKAELGRRA